MKEIKAKNKKAKKKPCQNTKENEDMKRSEEINYPTLYRKLKVKGSDIQQ